MTATVFLVRHAAHDNVGGFLAGRSPGVSLGEAGRAQARRLAERMRGEGIEAIRSSPRERTRETAEAIAAATGIAEVETDPDLDEIDFGAWSGRTFEDLDADPLWRRWNTIRSLARTPAGESFLDVQRRVMDAIGRVSADGADRRVVLVTHADVIKAAVMVVMGMPVDSWCRFEVEPASITRIVAGDWGAMVLGINEGVG